MCVHSLVNERNTERPANAPSPLHSRPWGYGAVCVHGAVRACRRQDFCSISVSCEIVSDVCCVKNKSCVLICPSTHTATELASFSVKLVWMWVRIFLMQVWLCHQPYSNQELFPNTKGTLRKQPITHLFGKWDWTPDLRWGGGEGCRIGARAGKGAESRLHTCLSFLWGLSSEAQFWERQKGNYLLTWESHILTRHLLFFLLLIFMGV